MNPIQHAWDMLQKAVSARPVHQNASPAQNSASGGKAQTPIATPGLEVITLEYRLRLKIKRNDWLLADTCPQATNHSALF